MITNFLFHAVWVLLFFSSCSRQNKQENITRNNCLLPDENVTLNELSFVELTGNFKFFFNSKCQKTFYIISRKVGPSPTERKLFNQLEKILAKILHVVIMNKSDKLNNLHNPSFYIKTNFYIPLRRVIRLHIFNEIPTSIREHLHYHRYVVLSTSFSYALWHFIANVEN